MTTKGPDFYNFGRQVESGLREGWQRTHHQVNTLSNSRLDCGNKDATVYTNSRILEFNKEQKRTTTFENQNSTIIEPCYIGNNVKIINSTVGPHASIGEGTIIENSKVKNSIIQTNCKIKNAELSNSMIGNFAEYSGKSSDVSISDYSTIRQ